ncbi:MAG: hypothetical protein K2R98_15565 [Gemmataceae bacterium]|nr:hypothetical protein [Gemmataceae bacterium]
MKVHPAITDAPSPKRPFLRIGLTILGILVGLWVLQLLFFNSTRLPPSGPAARGTGRQSGSGLESVLDTLRRENHGVACRSAIQQLNSHLSRFPDQKPPTLSDGQRDQLRKDFQLDDDELNELSSTSYTQLDAHHLEQCFLLQDAARALSLDGLPGPQRAAAAFAWVVRQVRLREAEGPASPPVYVLRRGWGNARERAIVFLALLDQLDIAGCMIAIPDPEDAKKPRYWIPAALTEKNGAPAEEKEIYLFDTRLGLPLPGPGLVSLAQLRAQPDVLGNVPAEKDTPYDLTSDQARRAEPHVACTLSALAPRMRDLQKHLAPVSKVRVSSDPAARIAAFEKAINRREFIGCTVRTWNSPAGDNSLRVLRTFLPPEDGGTDRPPRESEAPWQPRRFRFLQTLTPWPLLPAPFRSLPEHVNPGLEMRLRFARPFLELTLESGKPRDLVLRGRFDEAIGGLVERIDESDRQKAALLAEAEVEPAVARWCSDASRAQAEMLIAEQSAARSKSPEAFTALRSAQARVEGLWKSGSPRALVLLGGAMADPLGAEATFQVALCKQELAEQAQAGLGKDASPRDRDAAAAAWRDAAAWWKKYLKNYPAAPGEASATFLRSRALELEGKPREAAEMLASPSPAWSTWDRLSCRLRLKQLHERTKR